MINYESKDGYFKISEKFVGVEILVTHLFSTPIFGINDFKTFCLYNKDGLLIEYKNSLDDVIDYRDNPIKQTTKPRLAKD